MLAKFAGPLVLKAAKIKGISMTVYPGFEEDFPSSGLFVCLTARLQNLGEERGSG